MWKQQPERESGAVPVSGDCEGDCFVPEQGKKLGFQQVLKDH